jgi:ubiquinone/menaquinone biosynthesis C-methylase UbiE
LSGDPALKDDFLSNEIHGWRQKTNINNDMSLIAELYNQPEMLDAFGTSYLEWPEVMLLHDLNGAGAEMLDVGIGAGRTTVFFLPVAKRYVGVDISDGMVERAKLRLSGLACVDNPDIRVADATNLRDFQDESFDVVLFSFNGMDCIPEAGRNDCLESMKRVLRPGGRLVFSTHNLRYIPHYYQSTLSRNPIRRFKEPRTLMKELRRLNMNEKVNGPLEKLMDRDQVEYWDGFYANSPDAKHVHVKPEFQIKCLEAMGFVNIVARSKENGRVLEGEELRTTCEPWVYFFCNK